MKKNIYCLFIFIGLLFACETEVDMGSDHQSLPVVYCLFTRQEKVHQVVLTKTFMGNKPSRQMGGILDSLFFKEALVYFEFPMRDDTSRIYLQKKMLYDKEPGFFPYPDHIVYQTSESIPKKAYKIELYIDIPGLPTVFSTINSSKINNESLTFPHANGVTIEISEDSPWYIGFGRGYGTMWSVYLEAVIEIDIIEEDADLVQKIKKIRFIKKRYSGRYSDHESPKEISITTERLLHEIWSGIDINPKVVRRKFGTFKLTLYQGDQHYEKYMNYSEAINDYIINPNYSNIINGMGLFASRKYFIRDSLTFKSYSIRELIKDHRLQQLKFVE